MVHSSSYIASGYILFLVSSSDPMAAGWEGHHEQQAVTTGTTNAACAGIIILSTQNSERQTQDHDACDKSGCLSWPILGGL